MALTGTRAMCVGENNLGEIEIVRRFNKTIKEYVKRQNCGMAHESDWTKHTGSSAHRVQVFSTANSFIPWSRRIPMCDGYHELL